jgi:OPA family glycerol-3-phosphate transporter-like MFS transporter
MAGKPPDGSLLPFLFIGALCWFAYVAAYFGRVNLSISLPYLQEAYGFSKAWLGFVAGGFFTAYAAGQFINGVLGDRYNPRYFVGLGLFCAGLSNLLLGYFRQPWTMFFFWTLNGYFQSMLWGPLMRVIVDVTPYKYLRRIALAFSSSTVFGYFFSYTMVGRMVVTLGWKAAFYIPGAILLLTAALWVWFLRDYSRSFMADSAGAGHKTGLSLKRTIPFILGKGLRAAVLIGIFLGSVKEGFTLWGPAFFSESFTLPMDRVMVIMFIVPAMNIVALAASGLAYKCFRHQEKYSLSFFLITALVSAVLLRVSMTISLIASIAAVSGLSASLFAVNNTLTAFVPLNFQKERRVSAAAGILDCSIYTGAAISGPLAGFLVDRAGWPGVMNSWIVICGIAALAALTALIGKNYRKP